MKLFSLSNAYLDLFEIWPHGSGKISHSEAWDFRDKRLAALSLVKRLDNEPYTLF